MGESVGISYYINSPDRQDFSCINLKSCNRQGDGGRDGVPALALQMTEKYFGLPELIFMDIIREEAVSE